MIKQCVCGKEFNIRPRWLYKIIKGNKVTHYCSYNCWRANGGGESKKYYARRVKE